MNGQAELTSSSSSFIIPKAAQEHRKYMHHASKLKTEALKLE